MYTRDRTMRFFHGKSVFEFEAFVLYLHIQEYENIQYDVDIMYRLQSLLEQYEKQDEYERIAMSVQSGLKWDYLMVGDSLVMFTQGHATVTEIVVDVLNLEIELAASGVLVSGGLGRGFVRWWDKKNLAGEGIINAGKLARYSAPYPRIVIKEDLYTPELQEMRLVRRTLNPSIYYLDYLYPHRQIGVEHGYLHFMMQIKKLIKKGLKKYRYQESEYIRFELSNYLWLKKYFQRNLRYLPQEIARELAL